MQLTNVLKYNSASQDFPKNTSLNINAISMEYLMKVWKAREYNEQLKKLYSENIICISKHSGTSPRY